MTHIDETTTVAQLDELLRKYNVSIAHVHVQNGKFFVHFHLNMLRGPQGQVVVLGRTAATLADAFKDALLECDAIAAQSIVVRDASGCIRGLYKPDADGRKHARQHLTALGRGASLQELA